MKKKIILIISFLVLAIGAGITTVVIINNKTDSNNTQSTDSTPNDDIKKNKYVITFDTNGGSKIDNQNIEEGSKISKPNNPTKEGYEFDGWYVDSEFNVLFDFNSTINKNVTIYAKWAGKTIKHNVTFKNFDGTVLYETEVKHGNNVSYVGDAPTRNSTDTSSFEFIGWDKSLNNITSDTIFNAMYEEGLIATVGFEYELSADKSYYMIVGTGDINSSYVVVPKVFNGKPIKKINKDALSNLTNTKKLIIQNNIEEIESGALSNMQKLEVLEIPFVGSSINNTKDSKETFFAYIFGDTYFNSSLTATYKVSNYSSVTYYLPGKLRTVIVNGGSIFEKSFDFYSDIRNLYYSSNIKSIACRSNILSNNLKYYLEDSPDSSKLKSSFLTGTQYYNVSRDKIIFEDNFIYCVCDDYAILTDAKTSVDNMNTKEKITINNVDYNVTKIGDYAFSNCKALESINLTSKICNIGDYAFNNCSSAMSKVDLRGIENIGDYAFSNCKLVSEFKFDESLRTIGKYTFENCESITYIPLPEGITSIGDYAFLNCKSLTKFEVSNSLMYIGNHAFDGCTSLEFEIISSGSASGYYLTPKYYNVDKSDIKYLWLIKATGNGTFNMHSTTEHIYSKAFDINSSNFYYVNFSNNLKTIGDYAFCVNDSSYSAVTTYYPISLVDLSNTIVTYIGDAAFADCTSLVSVKLPDTIEYVGLGAFSGCSGLNYEVENSLKYLGNDSNKYLVLIGKDNSNLTKYNINENTRFICGTAFMSCKNLIRITIPKNVKQINYRTFFDCRNLEIIVLPSVENIGNNVFYYCDSLEKIYYTGSYEDYSKMIIGKDNDSLKNVTWYYFTSNGDNENEAGNWWYYDLDGVTIVEKVVA